MAITSVNGIVAGLLPPEEFMKVGAATEAAGVLHSFAYTAGKPGAMTAASSGVNGAVLTTKSGQIPFSNPASGNTYLVMLEACATTNGTLLVVDRIWENSGLTVTTTTAQAITTPTWPARDSNGATSGDDILVGVEVVTATTNASAITNMTLNYTNSSGTATRTGKITSFPATAVAGSFIPFQLASGDNGIQSIQGITLGTSLVSGAISLVAYRVLASIGMLANITESKDWQQLGMPRLYDNTVPQLIWVPSATTATTVMGRLVYSRG